MTGMGKTIPVNPEPDGKRLILEVRWGALAGRKAIVAPGQVLRVGRAEPAGFVIPDDMKLSELHFELSWDGKSCWLRDLKSKVGTLIGGRYVEEGAVFNGDWVRAGLTDFSVYFENETPLPAPPQPEPIEIQEARTQVLQCLRGQAEPLFAVLDAARDERILTLLHESVEECRSLYEGPQGDTLAEVAPYLVRLPTGSRLLESLVVEGWGRSWGVFLTSQHSFKDLRRQLRKFLMVQDALKQELYFRFYDPRVLREILPVFKSSQLQEIFERTDAFLVEGKVPSDVLRFTMHGLKNACH